MSCGGCWCVVRKPGTALCRWWHRRRTTPSLCSQQSHPLLPEPVSASPMKRGVLSLIVTHWRQSPAAQEGPRRLFGAP